MLAINRPNASTSVKPQHVSLTLFGHCDSVPERATDTPEDWLLFPEKGKTRGARVISKDKRDVLASRCWSESTKLQGLSSAGICRELPSIWLNDSKGRGYIGEVARALGGSPTSI